MFILSVNYLLKHFELSHHVSPRSYTSIQCSTRLPWSTGPLTTLQPSHAGSCKAANLPEALYLNSQAGNSRIYPRCLSCCLLLPGPCPLLLSWTSLGATGAGHQGTGTAPALPQTSPTGQHDRGALPPHCSSAGGCQSPLSRQP